MQRLPWFLAGLLGLALFARVEMLWRIVLLLAVVWLASRWMVQQASTHLEVDRRFLGRAFHGDEVEVTVTVRNAGAFPVPWVRLRDSVPLDLATGDVGSHRRVLTLGPKETKTFTYRLRGRRRGLYPIGPMTVELGDVLGVEERRLPAVPPGHLVVYPRIVALSELGIPTRAPYAVLPRRMALLDDPARIVGVRDHRPGDPLKLVHWKATATVGRLQVRQHQPAVARDLVVCLDVTTADLPRHLRRPAPELAVTAAASLLHHVVTGEGLPAGLLLDAVDPLSPDGRVHATFPAAAGRGHLMAMLDLLARIQPTDDDAGFDAALARLSTSLGFGSTICVIVPSVDAERLGALARLRRAGFGVVVLVYGDGDGLVSRRAGIAVHRLRDDHDLVAL